MKLNEPTQPCQILTQSMLFAYHRLPYPPYSAKQYIFHFIPESHEFMSQQSTSLHFALSAFKCQEL